MNRQRENHIRRIIVLGHSGFIGQRLLNYFGKKNPAMKILGYSREEIDLTNPRKTASLIPLCTDHTAVVMLSGIKPNVQENVSAFVQNISMVTNVCNVLDRQPVPRFIYMSSAAVYGEDSNNVAINEETSVDPRSYYGIAKYASERLLLKTYANKSPGSLLILRPPAIYGPGEQNYNYNPGGFLGKAFRKEEIILWGDGSEKREFIFVDDIVNIIHRLIFSPVDGVLNIASGVNYTFKDAVRYASLLTKNTIIPIEKKRTKEKADQGFVPGKFHRVVPNFTFTTLPDGMASLLSWLKKQPTRI